MLFLSELISGQLIGHIKSITNSSAIDIISLLHVVMALLFPVACVSSSSIFSLLDVIILSPLSNAVNIFAGVDLVCLLLSPHETFSENIICNEQTEWHV